ncbi:hypothetical protein DE146DRAFT_654532 [Phaeosphaeria sp. MPI-PUGE-AT-0046c]|nr:hypothetical protein DE146DRAFT_654532 [Phaeosphaeria sp. MPI-PUGE-AT-0046c]
MPGVPSSRGCDGCRKQKKKCDLIKPACSRCQRLSIVCTNAGTQRWKFQDQYMRGSYRSTFSDAIVIRQILEAPIPTTLGTEQSRLANALISIWKVDDLRYDISVYGDYFQFIPRRLGASRALDAATQAFVSAYPSLSTGRTTVEALAAYGKAISALGNALKSPTEVNQPNTLLALHLVQNVQCWIDEPTDQYVNHPLMIAHLLPGMIAQDWKDPADRLLLLISTILIIITAIGSSRVPFDLDQMRRFLKKRLPPRPYSNQHGAALETMSLDRLIELPTWSRAPRQHAVQIRGFYREAVADLTALQERASILCPAPDKSISELSKESSNETKSAMLRLWVQVQVGCSLQLAITIYLNAILRAMDDPFDQDHELIAEGSHLMAGCLQLARSMAPFLPLYASGISMTLICAWAAERDPENIEQLDELLRTYSFASIGDRWRVGGEWARRYLARLREEAVVLATCNIDV